MFIKLIIFTYCFYTRACLCLSFQQMLAYFFLFWNHFVDKSVKRVHFIWVDSVWLQGFYRNISQFIQYDTQFVWIVIRFRSNELMLRFCLRYSRNYNYNHNNYIIVFIIDKTWHLSNLWNFLLRTTVRLTYNRKWLTVVLTW